MLTLEQGGLGANAFGGALQAYSGMPPASFDPEHDVLSAMVKWVEEGVAPDTITATYWNNNNGSAGVGFTRPLCKVGVTKRLYLHQRTNSYRSSSRSCLYTEEETPTLLAASVVNNVALLCWFSRCIASMLSAA